MNKYMKILLPLLCLQWATVNGEIIGANEYSNDNFKSQLDGSFKKYFNDNIYRIKEYSRERIFFNRRQDSNSQPDGPAEGDTVQDLSCGGAFIANLKTCSSQEDKENSKFSCLKELTPDQFGAYLSCENSNVPNYGNLINAIVVKNLSNQDYLNNLVNTLKNVGSKNTNVSIEDVIMDVIEKLRIVANKNSLPYTTTHFIEEMSSQSNVDDEKLISTDYYNCLNLVDDEIYTSVEDTSVCLCSYGYDKGIKGYSKDVKLSALYSYYGLSEDDFNTICTPILAKANSFNNENEFISNLNDESLHSLLKGYNIPNYGSIFNEMMVNTLKTSTISLKKVVYDLYTTIGEVSRSSYSENEKAIEFGRCVVQANNRVLDNSGLSYCLCNAGFDSIPALNEVFTNHGLNQNTFNDKCSQDSFVKQNYTDCLDIGVNQSYLRQTKCLCDLYRAKWSGNGFLSCYGYTELSFILGCRQFYPNQMFSDNPARGIENFYSENYDDKCGDSGTGGGHVVHDPCICKIREENQEVSLELEDICSRVGTKPDTCSAGILSYKISGILMVFTFVFSLILYI
ncbi:hypothetical protein PIROE2DRAFT_69206 [Piromyces sp. E2]|nr:hypothetical protein PIROE2DRAFT_69206 [Piromyces sp. E2]|eukprot:OUM64674.1 hypothetical protein PIROE2DRAFT_69206 [Piromyces sp. E2]